jgi:hypothetical protein
MDEKVIVCPNCDGVNIETKKILTATGEINRYICIMCGYYTQDDFVYENKKTIDECLPRLYRDLCKLSKETELFWYPIIMDYSNLVILFPDGTNVDDWQWCVAPYEVIPKEERSKYPIQGKANEYHSHRVSLKHSQHYNKDNFISAMTFLNFLLKDTN